MKQTLLVLTAAIAFGAAAAHGQAPPPSPATITLQSATYDDFRQVLTRQAPTASVSIRAKLEFPEEARDRYPAVIVVHSLRGYSEANEGYFAAELRKAGFATLTYDSFAARGTTGQAFSALPGYLPAGVADAYAGLRRLTSEPRIDAGRIAILGFSYGGDVAHVTAFELLRAALDPGAARFAAHVAFYPAGNIGVIADGNSYTGSPVLMMLGGKDDNLPVAKMENYLAYAKATGHPAPVDLVIYAGAYHAWTVSDAPPLRFYPELVSTKTCPILLFGSGPPKILVGGETRPFDPNTYGACLREAPGYSLAYDAAVRAQSLADALRFLQRNLQP